MIYKNYFSANTNAKYWTIKHFDNCAIIEIGI